MKGNKTRTPIWESAVAITVICLFFPFFGVILLWISGKPRIKTVRIMLTLFLTFYAILLSSIEIRDEDGSKNEDNIEFIENKTEEKEIETENCAHEYGRWKIKEKAKCKKEGTKERICNKCKNKEQKVIEEKGHKWFKWEISKTATLNKCGKKKRKCKNCKEEEERGYELSIKDIKNMPEEEYKRECKKIYYEDIKDNSGVSKNEYVKIESYLQQTFLEDAYTMLSDDFWKENNIMSLYFEFGASSREHKNNYGGENLLLFSNDYVLDPHLYKNGQYITIYGKILDIKTNGWTGKNSIYVIPKYIVMR